MIFEYQIKNHLKEATNNLKISKKIIYSTYLITQNNRLLLRALERTGVAFKHIIVASLKNKMLNEGIVLSKSPDENLKFFFGEVLDDFNIEPKSVNYLKQLIIFDEKLKNSSYEFSTKGKAVFFDDKLKILELNLKILENFVKSTEELLSGAHKIGIFEKYK